LEFKTLGPLDLLDQAAKKHHVPEMLVLQLAWEESNFRTDPEPKREMDGTQSCGILQLNSASFPGACVMPVAEGIEKGVAYFASLYEQCKHREACAIRAYRTGKVK
jgi:hypothetical protein